MASLRNMFDLQKVALNSKLDDVIQDTELRYGCMSELDDDELENVAGGIKKGRMIEIACDSCQTINYVNEFANSYTCSMCGKRHIISG